MAELARVGEAEADVAGGGARDAKIMEESLHVDAEGFVILVEAVQVVGCILPDSPNPDPIRTLNGAKPVLRRHSQRRLTRGPAGSTLCDIPTS